jgi:hypothetical protein
MSPDNKGNWPSLTVPGRVAAQREPGHGDGDRGGKHRQAGDLDPDQPPFQREAR